MVVTLGVVNKEHVLALITLSCYDIDEKLKWELDMELVLYQRLMKNRLHPRLMFLNWQQCAFAVFVLCLLFAVNEVLLS